MASSNTLFICFLYCAFGLLGTSIPARAQYEPMLVMTPEKRFVYAKENERFTLSCKAENGLYKSINWLDPLSRNISNVGSVLAQKKGSLSTLVFANPKAEDSGEYACRGDLLSFSGQPWIVEEKVTIHFTRNEASNDTGSIESYRVVKVTENSVQFEIRTNGSVEDIQTKYIEKLSTYERKLQWKLGSKYEIKGLIPSGEYTFQFMPVPSQDGMWTKAVKVTLLPDVPDVMLHRMKDGALDIQWLRTTDDIRRGTIDKYVLSYFSVQMVGGNYWKNSTCVIKITIPNPCQLPRYSIADLSKNSFYEIQLKGHTSTGFGNPYRQKVTFWRQN